MWKLELKCPKLKFLRTFTTAKDEDNYPQLLKKGLSSTDGGFESIKSANSWVGDDSDAVRAARACKRVPDRDPSMTLRGFIRWSCAADRGSPQFTKLFYCLSIILYCNRPMIVICGRRVVLDAQCSRPLDHATGLSPDLSNTDGFNHYPDVLEIITGYCWTIRLVVYNSFTSFFMLYCF